jgi:hypothetical protein
MILSKIKSTYALGVLLALAGCRPDQVKHLPGTKRIAEETANWEVKRIMPNDLLHATRWAGASWRRAAWLGQLTSAAPRRIQLSIRWPASGTPTHAA